MSKYHVEFVDGRRKPIIVEANSVADIGEKYWFKKGDSLVACVNKGQVLYIKKIEE